MSNKDAATGQSKLQFTSESCTGHLQARRLSAMPAAVSSATSWLGRARQETTRFAGALSHATISQSCASSILFILSKFRHF